MKAIMISIKPKWCAKIMNGEKTIEVRKNKALYKAIQKLIDENGYADIYVYCSKDQELFYELKHNERHYFVANNRKNFRNRLSNGLVVFKFRCYKVDKFTLKMIKGGLYFSKSGLIDFPNEEAQLDNFELLHYAGTKLGTKLYSINISDLEIFDKPKELSEFKKNNATGNCWKCTLFGSGCKTCQLTKAPQNFCYVEVE